MIPWWWSWLLDGLYLVSTYVIGRKHSWGWLLSAFMNAAWVVYAVLTKQWGFIPGSTIAVGITVKNYRSWVKEEKRA